MAVPPTLRRAAKVQMTARPQAANTHILMQSLCTPKLLQRAAWWAPRSAMRAAAPAAYPSRLHSRQARLHAALHLAGSCTVNSIFLFSNVCTRTPGARLQPRQVLACRHSLAFHQPGCWLLHCLQSNLQGATVSASDISSSMAGEAQRRYDATIAAGATPPKVRACAAGQLG